MISMVCDIKIRCFGVFLFIVKNVVGVHEFVVKSVV